METKALLKKVRKIEIKTRRLSDHLFSGEYHSSFKGRGMTFSEVRPYQFGDDIRSIDWNVTARTNEPHVKVFEEERELTLMLMVDISGSEFFGTSNQTKKETQIEIAATLAFSAIQNNDKVGLILFTDEVELFIPPKKGKSHVLRIIREMIEFVPKNKKTDLNEALKFLSNVMRKKAIVFVLSDFMSSDYEHTLKICGNKHDLTGIRIFDKHEKEIPNIGMVPVHNPETGKIAYVHTASKKVRQTYQKAFDERTKVFKNAFKKSGSGFIDAEVNESYVKKLMMYFKQRSR